MKIEAYDLSFGYASDTTLFEGWTAAFTAGELVALTGPSGRGKSTALYLLGLMLRPRSGQIVIDDQVVSSLSDSKRAHLRAFSFGFVFQDAALDPTRSILDNVLESALYRGETRSESVPRAIQLISQFGVEVPPSRRPGEVSGGQAQRIALCRALLGRPGVILADEPTGNLDKVSSNIVISTLRHAAEQGAIVIIATHDEKVVARCDRKIEI